MPIAQSHRLMPPVNGPYTRTVNGRTYTCAVGSTIDVPEFDASMLTANGWIAMADGGVGTSAQRPSSLNVLHAGVKYHDSTLGLNIVWDGKTWRNPTNGAAV